MKEVHDEMLCAIDNCWHCTKPRLHVVKRKVALRFLHRPGEFWVLYRLSRSVVTSSRVVALGISLADGSVLMGDGERGVCKPCDRCEADWLVASQSILRYCCSVESFRSSACDAVSPVIEWSICVTPSAFGRTLRSFLDPSGKYSVLKVSRLVISGERGTKDSALMYLS